MQMDWKSRFESIGVKLPEKRLTTRELVEKVKIPGFSKFGLLTGINERRVCSAGEDSFSLAQQKIVSHILNTGLRNSI
jgi:hypothetical protein